MERAEKVLQNDPAFCKETDIHTPRSTVIGMNFPRNSDTWWSASFQRRHFLRRAVASNIHKSWGNNPSVLETNVVMRQIINIRDKGSLQVTYSAAVRRREKYYMFNFYFGGTMWLAKFLFPQPGIKSRPQKWKWRVVTTGATGNCHIRSILTVWFHS